MCWVLQADLQEMDVSDDSWNFAISNFNAYQCDLIPMEVSGCDHSNTAQCCDVGVDVSHSVAQFFTDPSLPAFDLEKLKLASQPSDVTPPAEATSIQDAITLYKTEAHHSASVPPRIFIIFFIFLF